MFAERRISVGLGRLLVGGWALFASGIAADAGQVYLALGDSITFGVGSNETATDVSNGDRGYVAGYADYLAGVYGTRPTVINLAVSGETSVSFNGQESGLDGPLAAARNLNYPQSLLPGQSLPSQATLMMSTIAAQLKSGNTISAVTLTLGANDLFLALAQGTDPIAALTTFQTNELNLLGTIRALLPTTNLTLLGYYDPYAPYLNQTGDPRQAIAQVSAQAIPLINSIIAGDAQAFQAHYANVYPLFVGNEIADTSISAGNVHPTDAGYALITSALVPEPASWLLVTLGFGFVPVVSRWKSRRDATIG